MVKCSVESLFKTYKEVCDMHSFYVHSLIYLLKVQRNPIVGKQ